jgi:hypothetical protein
MLRVAFFLVMLSVIVLNVVLLNVVERLIETNRVQRLPLARLFSLL